MNAERIEVSTMSAPDAFKLLITPQEAVELAGHRSIDDIYICKDIQDAHHAHAASSSYGPLWEHFTLLSTIWNAGRIQGIRSERLRRKQNIEQ